MDGGNNSLLDLARSAAIPPSAYHSNSSAVSSIASLVGCTTTPQDSSAMRGSRLNGWSSGYNTSDPATAAVVSHHGSAYPPYASSFTGAGAGATGVAKPGYTSFATGSDFLTNAQCNAQVHQLNQLSPLNSIPQRHNFSAFYSDMYNPNPNPGFFSDLAGLPSIPRFDPDGASGYMTETNPGKCSIVILYIAYNNTIN